MRRFTSLALAAILSFGLVPATSAAAAFPPVLSANKAAESEPDIGEVKVEGVYVVRGSDINLVSRESKVPIRIQNDFDADVRVHVHIQPNNNRLIVPDVVEIVVPALTEVTAQVPVKAIANGGVGLEVWVTTFSGIELGKKVTLRMEINADVESFLLVGLGSLVIALGVVGVIRTKRKNRKRHELEAAEAAGVQA